MKIDFNSLVIAIDGKLIPETNDPNSTPARLGTICVNALLAVDPNENIDGIEKFNRYNLAKKINDSMPGSETIDVSVEDIAATSSLCNNISASIFRL